MRYGYRDIIIQNVKIRETAYGFYDMRIDRTTIPEEKFWYEAASDDNSGGDPARIKEHILINFFETLICGR